MTRSFFPSGGWRFSRMSNACKTTLLNRGPMATYSRSRSMSSRTMSDSGDLYASSKTLANAWHFPISDCPTIVSALTSFVNGNSLPIASVAASAVFPDPAAPSRRHVNIGVLGETRTCSTSALHV
eukprot:31376-Pelagococcus_subviridis.AAC.2